MKNDDLIINRVRDLREDTDKTQEELAKELGVYTTTYARWERNPMSMKFPDIIRLAKHYKVSIDYIAGLTNEKRAFYGAEIILGVERQPQKTVRKSPIYKMPIPTATKAEQPPKRINNAPPEYIGTPHSAETKPIIAANSIPQPKKKK